MNTPISIMNFTSEMTEINNLKILEFLKKRIISVDTSLCSQTPPYIAPAKSLIVKETAALDKMECVESYISATEKGYQSKFLITLKDGYYFSALEGVHKQYCFDTVNEFKKAKPVKKPTDLIYSCTSDKNTIIWVLMFLHDGFRIQGISLCGRRTFSVSQTHFKNYGYTVVRLNGIDEVFKSFQDGNADHFLSDGAYLSEDYRKRFSNDGPEMVVFQLPDTMSPSLELLQDLKPEWFL